jgi:hypothetical protein
MLPELVTALNWAFTNFPFPMAEEIRHKELPPLGQKVDPEYHELVQHSGIPELKSKDLVVQVTWLRASAAVELVKLSLIK